jgi:hypothetical protein
VALVTLGALTVAGCGSGASAVSGAQEPIVLPSIVSPSNTTETTAPEPSTAPPTATPTARVTVRVTVTPHPVTTKQTTKKAATTTTKATPKVTPTPTAQASAAKLVAGAAAAAKGASFAHVVGTVVSGNLKYGVDLYLGPDGEGTLSYDKGSISVRRIGTALYLNADDAFFAGHGHPELAPTYNGKWMHIVPADPAYANILPLTYLSTWASLVGKAPAGTVAPATFNGVAATAITGGTGAKANTLFVPAAGAALPLGAGSADKVDSLAFSLWNNAPLPVQVPTALIDEPADAVVDVPAFPEDTAVAFSALWKA